MKASGVTRKIDSLGRIVIPIEIRRSLGWDIGDPIEFRAEGKNIVLHSSEKDQKTTEALDTLEEVDGYIQDPELKQKLSEVIRFIVTET